VDWVLIFPAELRKPVDRSADYIQQSAFDLFPYGHTDGSSQCLYSHATAKTVGTFHRHRAHNIFADVLLNFQENFLTIGSFYIKCIIDGG